MKEDGFYSSALRSLKIRGHHGGPHGEAGSVKRNRNKKKMWVEPFLWFLCKPRERTGESGSGGLGLGSLNHLSWLWGIGTGPALVSDS